MAFAIRTPRIESRGVGKDSISSRAGLLPVALSRMPIQAMAGIPIYIRNTELCDISTDSPAGPFTLYTAGSVVFNEDCRDRLLNHGVKFVYIPIATHDKFRRQTEAQIENIIKDPEIAAAAKWDILFETTTEIANELLSQRNFGSNIPRLEPVSRAVSTLVLNDKKAFAHLFKASSHDFYTATHMVNVGTSMVTLAYSMGHHTQRELSAIFQAGILHDIGKMRVSKEILNKTGHLTAQEWTSLRAHPQLGFEQLAGAGVTDPVILAVTLEHHERLDGSGYPGGLAGNQIHPVSRICAVIDTFDAMTSVRPFKTAPTPIIDAMEILYQESPSRYDTQVLGAWADLVRTIEPDLGPLRSPGPKSAERRAYPRKDFHCPVLLRVKDDTGRFEDAESISAVAQDLSATGMALIMPAQVAPGQKMRIHLQTPGQVRVTRCYTAVCVRCRTFDDGWFEVGVQFSPG